MGTGFASDPPFSVAAPNPNIFDHGISQGASEALDFETTPVFVLTVNATDGSFNDTAQITVNLVNANDNVPQIDDATAAALPENSANGTAVFNVNEAFTGTDLRSAHVVARRLASVLKHTMLSPGGDRHAIKPTVTLATLKPTDNLSTLVARVGTYPKVAGR